MVFEKPMHGRGAGAGEDEGQQLLSFVEKDRKAGKRIAGYEYAVLVNNTDYEILSLPALAFEGRQG
jgi:hypothetical protein